MKNLIRQLTRVIRDVEDMPKVHAEVLSVSPAAGNLVVVYRLGPPRLPETHTFHVMSYDPEAGIACWKKDV